MPDSDTLRSVTIPPDNRSLSPLALGGTVFVPDPWGSGAADLLATMNAALEQGINHFDTASGYGNGDSERLVGRFLAGKRDRVFVASKAALDQMSAALMVEQVDQSLSRLQTDVIELYYIHWPRQGQDLRPLMEGLETARRQGKIKAIGVSNFNVQEMEQVAEVGHIDVHQLCYNLLWRFAEADIIPYCQQHGIAVVTYSSIAQGLLAGKFPRQPQFDPSDSRGRTVHFYPDVWPHMYEAVEQFKQIASEIDRPLAQLAIRWVLQQPSIHTAVVSARSPEQVEQNIKALDGEIPDSVFARLTAISDEAMNHVPDTGNIYRYYP